jgi:hypothetical protein
MQGIPQSEIDALGVPRQEVVAGRQHLHTTVNLEVSA